MIQNVLQKKKSKKYGIHLYSAPAEFVVYTTTSGATTAACLSGLTISLCRRAQTFYFILLYKYFQIL